MDWSDHIRDARAVSADLGDPDGVELRDILEEGVADQLPLARANRLFNLMYSPDFPALQDRVLDAARRARRRTFGNKATVMAPVEVSNRCASDCLFCGWRASNPGMPRRRIGAALVVEQVNYLLDLGIGYIELVGGDDFRFVRDELPGLVRAVRAAMTAKGVEGQVCVCSMAVTGRHYREWAACGVDSMFVWQETYDPELYAEHIVAGPKARGIGDDWTLGEAGDGYAFRVGAQTRAVHAGLDVGLGFMIGLNPNVNYEFLMTLSHVQHLAEECGVALKTPVILGMPTWNPITTPLADRRPARFLNAEAIFPYLAATLFLSLPKGRVWVFPNCRVSLAAQLLAVEVAGPFTSTEVKLGPGGYLPAVLRARQSRDEDTGALRDRIRAEFGMESGDLERMEASLDAGEQFTHHFHPHAVYAAEMARRGLELVPLSGLLAATRAALRP